MVYMSRVGILKHLRSVFVAYRSVQLLSLLSGFSQSFFLLLHHAAPARFPIREERWEIILVFELNPPPQGSELEQGSSVGPAQVSILYRRLQR